MNTQARNLQITKKPREDPLPDKPVDFPSLENLHLEFLENKKKIKKGLPLVPTHRRKPPRPTPKVVDHIEPVSKEKKEHPPRKEKKATIHEGEDRELLKVLGEDKVEDEEDTKTAEEVDLEVEEEELEDEDEEDDPYAGLSPEEREEKEKQEYIWRFRILKKQYKNPQIEIPSFNEHSDLPTMKSAYDRTMRELYLDDAVESYRTYLVGGFMVMEYVCTQWAGIDMSGFTVQQTKMMYKYDRMLIELGEKSYNRWGMNFPVEVRLIGLILMQAGMFYLGKILTSKFGHGVAEIFRGITGQPPPQREVPQQTPNTEPPTESDASQPRRRRKMRGPKIKPDDIRNMSNE